MTTRPSMADLANRRAPALHRTLPTWARERKSDDCIEYRMYAPHPAGGTLFITEQFTADTSRAEVAARLRILRAVIWGRDKQVTPAEAARKREARAERMALNRAAAEGVAEAAAPEAAELDVAPPQDSAPEPTPNASLPATLTQTVGEAEALEQQAEPMPAELETPPSTEPASVAPPAEATQTPSAGPAEATPASMPAGDEAPQYAQQSLF